MKRVPTPHLLMRVPSWLKGLCFGLVLAATPAIEGYAQQVLYSDCQDEFATLGPAQGGVLDPGEQALPSPMPDPHPTQSVLVPVFWLDDTPPNGKLAVRLVSESQGIELKPTTRPFEYSAVVPIGRYRLIVELQEGNTFLQVAPSRYVTVVLIKSSAFVIPAHASRTPMPYYRLGKGLVPSRSEPKYVAVMFQTQLPTKDEALNLANKVFPNDFGLQPAKPDPLRKLEFYNANGAVLLFELTDPEHWDDAVKSIRGSLDRPARIGVPFDISPGRVSIIDNYFSVALRSKIEQDASDAYLKSKGATRIRRLTLAPTSDTSSNGTWLIRFDESQRYCAHLREIELAFRMDEILSIAEPDFVSRLSDHHPDLFAVNWPNDMFYSRQNQPGANHFEQRVPQTWNQFHVHVTTSTFRIGDARVVIGSVDRGVNTKDEEVNCQASDGTDQVTECYDYPNKTSCKPVNLPLMKHGMAVFGIISACTNNNTKQVAGLAPGTHHVAVVRPEYIAGSAYADLLRWVGGIPPACWQGNADSENPCPPVRRINKPADVINGSHNFYLPTGSDLPISHNIAFDLLVSYGRGGLGTVLVYSAGNGNPPNVPVRDVNTYEPMARDDRVIGVANCWWNPNSSNSNKLEPHESSYFGDPTDTILRDPLDVCAIGEGSVTIKKGCHPDQVGPCLFGGTSAAAANVSGTVGLMLSVNKCLTYQQVQEILRVTAQPYVNPWSNRSFGKGVINTFAAVARAKELLPPNDEQCQ